MDGAFAVWNLLYFTVLGVVIMLLLADSRFSAGRTAAIGCAALAVLLPAEVAVYRHMGLLALVDLYTPLVHLPRLVLFIWLSRQRNWQMVFQLLSAILFCFLIHQGASLCWLLSGGRLWAMAAGYAVLSAAVIVFHLRPGAGRAERGIPARRQLHRRAGARHGPAGIDGKIRPLLLRLRSRLFRGRSSAGRAAGRRAGL